MGLSGGSEQGYCPLLTPPSSILSLPVSAFGKLIPCSRCALLYDIPSTSKNIPETTRCIPSSFHVDQEFHDLHREKDGVRKAISRWPVAQPRNFSPPSPNAVKSGNIVLHSMNRATNSCVPEIWARLPAQPSSSPAAFVEASAFVVPISSSYPTPLNQDLVCKILDQPSPTYVSSDRMSGVLYASSQSGKLVYDN